MYLCRYSDPQRGARLGLVRENQIYDLGERWPSLAAFLDWTVGREFFPAELADMVANAEPVAALADLSGPPAPSAPALLKPTDAQEVWAAGVTYERSKVAREEESAGSGIYDRVYGAARPELFFKATPSRTVGPYEPVAIRADARWNVPEPELALVVNQGMELVGFTIGNDMSSRDIEGENPLYLPQAKVYARCCALGPLIALSGTLADPADLKVELLILRAGNTVFSGQTSTRKIVRPYTDLIGYLGRDNLFPDGVVLLTGTGIVPPDNFTLQAGDEVVIVIEGIGELRNPVIQGAA
jgi:2-dehydro-3-deoxy-D-arabinonate dehydratase